MRSALSDWTHEIALALRVHRHNLPTAAAVVITLSLGIGASTSVFSVANALYLRPLPYGQSDSLVLVWEDASARGGGASSSVSGANFLDWREANTSFDGLAAVRNITRTFTDLPEPHSPLVHAVTSNYFGLLGVEALLGRTFATGEDAGQGAPVTILSYGIWQRLFGADPNVVGRTVALDGAQFEIIGVMPRSFHSVNVFPGQPEIWVPLPIETFREERAIRRFIVYGRIKAGITLEQAQSSMSTLARLLAQRFPDANEKWGARVVPIREQLVGDLKGSMTLIVVAVASLLLITAFNVVCLLLATGSARAREMASRSALGASPRRIVRQLLVEAVSLALAGAALALVVAAWSTRYILALIPQSAGIPFLETVEYDVSVAAFALGCGIAIAVLCAFVTARQALRSNAVAQVIRQTGRYPSEGRVERRLRQGLVVAQVALSVMLLLAAGLMAQSFRNFTTFPLGFEPADTMRVWASVRGPRYSTPDAQFRFFEDVVKRIRDIPGVVSASVASAVPPLGRFDTAVFSVDDRAASLQDASAIVVVVQPRYFETLDIPVIGGRTITEFDTAQSPRVVMISRELARKYFDGEEPLGRTLVLDEDGTKTRREIIGVVDDVRSAGADPRPYPVVYLPHTQTPYPDMGFVVRMASGRGMPTTQIRRIVLAIDPTLPVFGARALDAIVTDVDWKVRFVATLLGAFTFVGLALVAAGVYGVLAFVVAARQQEIGLRIALGARFSQIAQIVLGFVARVVGLGAILGIAGFFALGTLLESLLFGVTRTDSTTFAGVLAVVFAVTVIVCISPLTRALRVSPLIVMRSE